MNYHVEAYEVTGRDCFPPGTMGVVDADSPAQAAERAEAFAKQHALAPPRIAYVVCYPYHQS